MSSGELSFESPPFLRVTWNIPDFFRLAMESEYSLQSPDFTFADNRYCVKLSMFHDFIRISVQSFIDTVTEDVWYEVQFKSATAELEQIGINSHLSSEIFISSSDFQRKRDLYVPDGTLSVLCSMRLKKPSSAGIPKSGGAQTRVIPKYTMSGELSFESFPLFYVAWKIPGFFQLSRDFLYFLESPEFPFSDCHYCLRLFSFKDQVKIKLVNLTAPGRYDSYETGFRSTTGEEIYTQHCLERHLSYARCKLDTKKSECFSDGHLTVFCVMPSREPNIAESTNSSRAETKAFPRLKVPVPQAAATHLKSGGAETSNEEKDKEELLGIAKLQSDYRKLLLKGVQSDACFVVCGKEFHAHQIILRARSTVFDAMFGHETAEKDSGRVVIDDLDPDSFGHFLEYLYTGGVGAGLSDENVFGLYKAADKYDVSTLKAECVPPMRKSLSVDSFCDFLAVALRHPQEELLPQAVTFFRENMARIIVTVKWQQFVIDNGTSANELLIKAVVPAGQ